MKETKDSSQRLNKAEKSWILYDVANSAFIMIVTATIPIYFRSLAEGSGMSGTSATSLWGSATSISILILALLSPVLGAIADYENMKKKILCLAMVAIMAVGIHTTAFAETLQGGSDWKVEFNGSKMSSNFTSADMKKDIFQLQPGDTMELQVGLKNTSEKDADWYMTNEVLKSLEDSQSIAEGGAYGYKLTYVGPDKKETVLYDSETVGGEDAQKGEGLHQATDALEKYLYLDRLSKGDVASVHLTVKLDGETQGNDYQDTLASLQMSFAADPVTVTTVTKKGENKVVNKTVTKTVQTPTKNVVRSPKTGDTTQILAISAVALASGVILLILAVVLIKKRKEEKGEGQR